MEEKITIDRQTFKALAADTRIEILKLLGKRRHTQSELSAELKLSVPTVKEHLDALEKANLVAKSEEGYKWKYYMLTEKAKCLLDPERKKVWVLLASLLVALTAGALVSIYSSLFASIGSSREKVSALAAPSLESAAQKSAEQIIKHPFPYATVIFIIIIVILAVLFFYYLAKSRILRKR